MTLAAADLNPKQFQKISDMVYRTAGINLKEGKEALVRARLMKRLRFLGMSRVEDYIEFIDSDQGTGEVAALIDVMTTNKTSFFREVDHFHFLREQVLPGLNMPRVRFWSAACSSGEEPYTLAILLREHLPELDRKDVRILATDISRRMLDKALQAVYPQDAVDEVPAAYRKYFTAQHRGRSGSCQVAAEARALADRIGAARRDGVGAVLSCSALKRSYRDTLRRHAPGLAFVFLDGSPDLLAQRMAGRSGHYMPPSLLTSQLATLEPPGGDERALTLDIARPYHGAISHAVFVFQIAFKRNGNNFHVIVRMGSKSHSCLNIIVV